MPHRPAIQLSVPQPCHEAWEQMTPTGAGRHCASCDKVVVDFTRMTDGELAAWLAARAGQPTCGRLRSDQVERVLLPAARPVPGWWRWAVATLAVLGVRTITASPSSAQQVKRTAVENNKKAGSPAVVEPLTPISVKFQPDWKKILTEEEIVAEEARRQEEERRKYRGRYIVGYINGARPAGMAPNLPSLGINKLRTVLTGVPASRER